MNTVTGGGSRGSLETGLQTAKLNNIKGWEANERNEFGSLGFSYLVNGTFVNETIQIADSDPGDDSYLKRKLNSYSQNVARHLFQLGVTLSEFNGFVVKNWVDGVPNEEVSNPETLASLLMELIPSLEIEGHLLVHLGSNNKHYAYSSGVGVFRTYKDESFEDIVKMYNKDAENMPDHISKWGQNYICPFFTNPVEIEKKEIAILDYRNPGDEPEVQEWTVITEKDGDATVYFYTDRFNWNPNVEEVSADFDQEEEVSEEELDEVFGDLGL